MPLQKIKIINAQPNEMRGQDYKNGDVLELLEYWAHGGGATARDAKGVLIELYSDEFICIGEQPADVVNSPTHYNSGKFETIEIIEAVTAGYDSGYLAYCVGNTMKYIARAPFKHETPLEDMKKAAKYLEFAIKALEKEVAA